MLMILRLAQWTRGFSLLTYLRSITQTSVDHDPKKTSEGGAVSLLQYGHFLVEDMRSIFYKNNRHPVMWFQFPRVCFL